jgi:hypothetical protein
LYLSEAIPAIRCNLSIFKGKTERISTTIGAMTLMLEDLIGRVEDAVKNMDQYELDYLHNERFLSFYCETKRINCNIAAS